MITPLLRWLVVLAVSLLAACASGPQRVASHPVMDRAYTPPGKPRDPWGPFVREASAESGVPEHVLYAVMWAESRGCQWLNGRPMQSKTGEAGLMQVPPSIYARFRGQTHLPIGTDPWVPRDNIRFAAWSLSRYMHQYGLPHALAAYVYGPTEVDRDEAAGRPLPKSAVAYERGVWADAQSRAARRASGRRWTDPDKVVCEWDGH